MRGTLVSINAIYNFDDTIFDDLQLPAVSDLPDDPDLFISNPEPLDKDLLIGNILMELGELSLIYWDPSTLKKMIRIWSAMHKRQWLDLWKTLLYSYNPIWNKDGTYTETLTRNESGNRTENETIGTNLSTSTISDSDTRNNVTGYNTNSYSPDTQIEADSSLKTESGSDSGRQLISGDGKTIGETLTRIERGNIGVMSTQELIARQREIVEFNLYQYITESFKTQFCVMVY